MVHLWYINEKIKIRCRERVNPGIYRDKTMSDKLIYIPNDNTQNYPFFRLQLVVEKLNTQLNELTNQNLVKVPKSN